MKYLSTTQAAETWNITRRRITILATEGRIPGAVMIGARWMIPENAEKPKDARTKEMKSLFRDSENEFRFRIYSKYPDDSFSVPLSAGEIKIRTAVRAFFAGRFDELERILPDLPLHDSNRYLRIFSLYVVCMLSFVLVKTDLFLDAYGKLSMELQEDFPRKREMKVIFSELRATLGDVDEMSKAVNATAPDSFHPDFLSHLTAIHTLSLFYSGVGNLTKKDIQLMELNCSLMERTSDSAIDLLNVHLYLGLMNEMVGNTEGKVFHLNRTFDLAEQYELYWLPSMQYQYMGASFDSVLRTRSPEFTKRLLTLSKDIQQRREAFMKQSSQNSIFDLLPQKKYLFAYYAVRGFTNKEVSHRLGISEKTVKKNYSMIYETLDISSKKELIDFFHGARQTENKF